MTKFGPAFIVSAAGFLLSAPALGLVPRSAALAVLIIVLVSAARLRGCSRTSLGVALLFLVFCTAPVFRQIPARVSSGQTLLFPFIYATPWHLCSAVIRA